MGLAAGQVALDEDFAAIAAASTEKPIVQLYQSVGQSIPDNTLTALTFGAENFDSHGFHSTSVNPSRVTPNVAGVYRCTGHLFLQPVTTLTYFRSMLRKNGATQLAPAAGWGNIVNAVGHQISFTVLAEFDGLTDYAEMCVTQDNTANSALNTIASNPYITMFEMEYVRGPI